MITDLEGILDFYEAVRLAFPKYVISVEEQRV